MKYISLGEVMWELTNNPLTSNITYEDAAQHVTSLLKIMKIPLSMSQVVDKYEVTDYKARLPESVVTIKGVRSTDGNVPLTYGTNTFHMSHNDESKCSNEMTYIVQNCNIITSFEKGEIEVSYYALELDEEGFPMIPSEESIVQAIKYHIMMKYTEPLWMMGKITDKAFNHIQQQRAWYVGQADAALKLLNMDHAVAMMNSVNRILVNTQAHTDFYKNSGKQEQLKRHW